MCAIRRVNLTAAFGTVLSLMASVANAQFTAVTRDGVTLINDSSLNVTWIADAGLSGPLTWGSAQAWVAGLNASDYGGYNNWQLPTGDGVYTTNPLVIGGIVKRHGGCRQTQQRTSWAGYSSMNWVTSTNTRCRMPAHS